ncbi:hypothetical protein PTSG_08715 [Salpingoeca rosetta]|uniref:Tetratricopeptide repeat protein 29 n=1 Tax=Salpingoeca rosetta (strain ATCC 50818 / BSB-021) TaxID=946362 RepID=F2UKH1_SALR5|nr:uncharacterized protein PTSG_08715 [Salpingoeca rosetta]EGD77620.1 hypothetical protein PTSG_08715 [Salpingoeca rosetta]|eukprot:XP_004990508.1 hypothetical protein PTSG_08715 [Salpingoeca rosetta]
MSMISAVLEDLEPASTEAISADITTQAASGTTPQEVHFIVAQELDRRGDTQAAITAYEDFIEAAAENEDLMAQVHAYRRVAQLHRQRREIRQAITAYQHMLSLAQEAKQMPLICAAYGQLGSLYLLMAQETSQEKGGDGVQREQNEERLLSESLNSYTSLLTIATTIHDRRAITQARRGLGLVHAAMGDWAEARVQLERHLAGCKQVGTPRQQAQACHLLAEALGTIVSSAIDTAMGATRALFHKQVELRWQQAAMATEANDTLLLIQAYVRLGDLYANSGSYTQYYGAGKARECYQLALDAAKGVDLAALGKEGADAVRRAADHLDKLSSSSCSIS